MIQSAAAQREKVPDSGWQSSLRNAISDPVELCRRLSLPAESQLMSEQAHHSFQTLVTEEFLARIEPGNPQDPLLLQVLPVHDELAQVAGFVEDAVGDTEAQQVPGLLQKYSSRVLMMLTMNCPIHCRYCFRRNYLEPEFFDSATESRLASPRASIQDERMLPKQWRRACEWIASESSVNEVILSGGDPLMVPDERLACLVRRLEEIPHLTTIRLHTRLPVMIPNRVNESLLGWLRATRLKPVVVLHINHARELDQSVADAAKKLAAAGVLLLNQSVLLRQVNDSVEALVALSQCLIQAGISPYYLNQLDRAKGTAHFEVPLAEGRVLMEQLRKQLPGYAVPRFVKESKGSLYKLPLA